MPMDDADREVISAEADAAAPEYYQRRNSDEVERIVSASSVSTVSSMHTPGARNRMSYISTHRDLDRHYTELSRIETQRTQHFGTVGSSAASVAAQHRKPLPSFGAGKPFPPPLPARDEYVVEFDGPGDPLNAQNWPTRVKVAMVAMLNYTTFVSSFTSSIYSPAIETISKFFHVDLEVALLGTTLYVLGFAFGPSLWAPLSELRGRRMPIILSMFGFSVFCIGAATAKDIQTLLICRFFSGFFGSCSLAVVAAIFSDMFNNVTRGIAITCFTMTVFLGPFLAPFIGGYIVESYLGWRWTLYLPTILGFFAFFLDLFFLKESYAPVILVGKAAELRRRTRNWGIHAKQEEIEIDLTELINKNFSRPMRMLFTEPILFLLTLYMSFLYGLLYLFLTAYNIVFVGIHHFSLGEAGLTFFGMIIGVLIAGIVVFAQQPWYQRKLKANNGVPVPEWRLPSVMAGGICFVIGIFWFGWTGYKASIPWIAPAASGIFTGFGLMSIFLQSINYIVDAYLMFAASALAGNTFMRSLAGATFPLFARQMFLGMGVQWASTLLGCLALLMCPIPFIFYKYGSRLREKSQFAPTPPRPPRSNSSDAVGDGETLTEKRKRDRSAATSRDTAVLSTRSASAAGDESVLSGDSHSLGPRLDV
ncbi:major facilitator superfamily [Ophiocordyceps camponoti-floridani]|uniref:Major facilitator superfamily n=1 Tax=Ophiocordyceps camponoti-floridani TaxID=2030778 RepID=A0A8H4Q6P0_9HYPO|nr:major facilitator superfamily [Ophiocordyceps camponoti-floridani]